MYVPTRVAAIVIATLSFSVSRSHAASERVDELIHASLQMDVDAARGREIYRTHCASCHGPEGHGNAARGVPALAGQRQAYIIKQLADFSELERDSQTMHDVVSRADLAEPQVWADVAGYVNGLSPIARPERGDGRYVELGEAIFREQCSSCHEEDARGDDDGFVPSLRNQHYTYLLNEMRTIARWHSRNLDDDLERFLDSLDEDEMTGLADHLSRQHGPAKDRLRMRDDGSVGD